MEQAKGFEALILLLNHDLINKWKYVETFNNAVPKFHSANEEIEQRMASVHRLEAELDALTCNY